MRRAIIVVLIITGVAAAAAAAAVQFISHMTCGGHETPLAKLD